MSELVRFIGELKRRHVFRVAAIYAVVAWALIQVVATVQPYLHLPAWTVTLVIVLLAIGLPVALFLGWAFDLTPDGVQRTLAGDAVAAPRLSKFAVVVIVLIALAGGGWLAYARGATGADAKSIAVLPFTNLSADAANEYFADGIHEQILTQLTQIADLHVISRTSVIQYKQQQRNLREIAQALGVGTILEGSVQRDGKRVRIHAQLIDAKRDKHLWSESYDRDLTDVFAIQSSIAQEIATELRAQLSGDERAALATAPTRSTEAYDLYLRARQLSRTVRDLEARVDLFRRALALDSTFVGAQIGLAEALFDLVDQHFVLMRLPAAESAATRALQLDPNAAEAHGLLSRMKSRVFDFDGALAEAAIARELKPDDPDMLRAYAMLLANRGLFTEAIHMQMRVLELDPASSVAHQQVARMLRGQGQWSEAERHLQRAIALDPDDPGPYDALIRHRAGVARSIEDLRPVLEQGIARYGAKSLAEHLLRGSGNLSGLLLELRPDLFDSIALGAGVDSVDYYIVAGYVKQRKGDEVGAHALFEQDRIVGEKRARALFGTDPRFQNPLYVAFGHSDLALALAGLGNHADAIKQAERGAELTPLSLPTDVSLATLWIVARVYVSAGRHDDAIAALERMLASPLAPVHAFTPTRLAIDPMFAPLRGQPAFDRLTKNQ
jgi:adenylate cyclase